MNKIFFFQRPPTHLSVPKIFRKKSLILIFIKTKSPFLLMECRRFLPKIVSCGVEALDFTQAMRRISVLKILKSLVCFLALKINESTYQLVLLYKYLWVLVGQPITLTKKRTGWHFWSFFETRDGQIWLIFVGLVAGEMG